MQYDVGCVGDSNAGCYGVVGSGRGGAVRSSGLVVVDCISLVVD